LLACLALALLLCPRAALAQPDAGKPAEPADVKKIAEDAAAAATDAKIRGDTAWMLVSSALVMLMVPGLALFYAGMVRRKNVLATMMHSMVALAVVGVYWVVVGYSLAFGQSIGGYGFLGWSNKLLFLAGVQSDEILPATNVPVYVHVMFQGMFAIITPALISGAVAERIRFLPYSIFLILWVTLVYCPLAHGLGVRLVLRTPSTRGAARPSATSARWGRWTSRRNGGPHCRGLLGLAAILVLRSARLSRRQPPQQHGADPDEVGPLWFGWFGFNGGVPWPAARWRLAFATQAAAAAAGGWMIAESLPRQADAAGWRRASSPACGGHAGVRLRADVGWPGHRGSPAWSAAPPCAQAGLRHDDRWTRSAFTASAASWRGADGGVLLHVGNKAGADGLRWQHRPGRHQFIAAPVSAAPLL
jgi:hypothetical protein